ncbi:MAG: 4Fe-4S dicluster domain-containing protein [Thermodesulfobacteriota bacterium]|nr:4Fe-4S dicluster domain-containing protein [Thermodesulfobacteriota bacterium]
MNKPTTSLITPFTETIQDIPSPDEVHVPLIGHTPVVQRKKKVLQGTVIAKHPVDDVGDIHAPVSGKVTGVTPSSISLKTDSGNLQPKPVDISAIEPGKELVRILKGLGVNTRNLNRSKTLIINGFNPEPGISVYDQLLRDHQETLERGLELVRKLISPSSAILAVPGRSTAYLSGCVTFHIKTVYPNSLNRVVVKSVTGFDQPENVAIVPIPQLYSMGKVLQTGLPLTETIITIGKVNYRVKIGTPIRMILGYAGISVQPGDRVILGGPFRGSAVYSLDQGVDKDAYGISVIPQGTFSAVTDAPCLNCGECVLHCPSRIMPNIISRMAEFGLFEKTIKYGIESCFECGLCTYFCPARRPVLQYILLAKDELFTQQKSKDDGT